jgi:hypothetical protein
VGIGTTSPLTKLHIEGPNNNDGNDFAQVYIKGTGTYPLDIAGLVIDSAGSHQSHVRFSNNGSPKFQIRYNNGSVTTDKLFFYSFTQSSDMVTMDGATGNVGIGLTGPLAKLHVADSGCDIISESTSVGQATRLRLKTTTREYRVGSQNDNFWIYDSVAASYRLWIKSDGNVGIGTTSPGYKLDVVGSIKASVQGRFASGSAATPSYSFDADSDSGMFRATTNALGFSTSGTERMRITSAGNILVGGSNDYSRISVTNGNSARTGITLSDGNTASLMLFAGNSADAVIAIDVQNLSFKTGATVGQDNGTERMRISSAGAIKFNAYGAGTLVTDASGNITVSSGGGAGGPYLPLSAGSSYPLTGDLYLDDGSGASPSLYFKNQSDNFWRYLMESGGDFSIKEGTSTRLTFQAGGNVGIGTTSPNDILHVSKVGAATRLRVGNNGAHDASIYFNTSTDWSIGTDTSNSNSLTFGNSSAIGTGTKMVIETGGNVGIGLTNPSSKLTIETNAGDGTIELLAVNAATTKNKIIFSEAVLGDESFFIEHDGAGAGADNLLKIHGDGSGGTASGVTIRRDGRVGIGTNSPVYKLDVAEKIRIVGGLKITPTTSNLYAEDGALSYYGSTNGVYLNGAGANGWLRLQASGVENDQNSINIYGSASAYMTFRTANSTRMIINSAGNVGIGTTSPGYKLDVNGGIQAGGVVTYSKAYGSLNTTGNAVAGLTTSTNGQSAGFTFTCFGHSGGYQKIVYSCYNGGGNWYASKVIDEGTNQLDVVASANSTTITFTFKSISGTMSYTPRVTVEAVGTAINSTYA